jgi:hypothetical protein
MTEIAREAPIFIVGYMHSGTTLLQNAIARNSSVFTTRGETKYFDFLPMTAQRFGDLSDNAVLCDLIRFTVKLVFSGYVLNPDAQRMPTAPDIADDEVRGICREITVRDYPQVFAAVMDYLAARSGKPRWLEKTPTHIFSIDRIAEGIPEARFVEIVRDPRDVLSSKKTRRETVWTDKRYDENQRAWKHLEKSYDPLWDALSWKSAVNAGMAADTEYEGKYYRVRYEDLVADPEGEVRRLCGFCGLRFEPTMLDVPSGRPAAAPTTREHRGRGVATDSIARWRHVMSEPELALIQAINGREMRILHYEEVFVGWGPRMRAVPLVVRSVFEFFGRLSRRARMAGWPFLSLVMGNYMRRAMRLVSSR